MSVNDETLPDPSAPSATVTMRLQARGIEIEPMQLPGSALADSNLSESGRYTIGAEVNLGGMGSVVTARDMNLQRKVAMKIALAGDPAEKAGLARFIHEAQVTGQLEHPSVVPVYELGVNAEDCLFYTMKYIQGASLAEILGKLKAGDPTTLATYPLTRLLDIWVKVTEAISFAHSRGVVHQNLSPDNIMVGNYGEVLVVGWGLARILEADGRAPGEKVDSVDLGLEATLNAYLAPEQVRGEAGQIPKAMDVYALGGLLYAILTLGAPFEAGGDLREKILAGALVPADLHRGAHPHCPNGVVPPPLSSVAMRAMAKAPEARYGSVDALRADVHAYLNGYATSAEDATLVRLVQLFMSRHRTALLTAAAALVVLAGAVTIAFMVNLEARRNAEAARGRAQRSQQEAESALRAFSAAQAKGQQLRRSSAPALTRAARQLIVKGDMKSARVQADLARDYDPALADAQLLAAQMRAVAEEYAEAATCLRTYLSLVPDSVEAKQMLTLCENSSRMTAAALQISLADLLSRQKAWQLADRLNMELAKQFTDYQKRVKEALYEGSGHVKRRADGWLVVDLATLGNRAAINLQPLAGMPIADLRISQGKVTNIEPLKGMPLQRLELTGMELTDLAPLKDMAELRELSLAATLVADLRPLAALPLERLDISKTRVADLTPLKKMPLRELSAWGNGQLSDITPLKGVPLESIRLSYTAVTDISTLGECPTLKSVDVSNTKITALQPLWELALEGLQCDGAVATEVLKKMPLKRLKIGSLTGALNDLAGLALEEISIGRTPELKSLDGLQGMPLKVASFRACGNLRDISALRDAPLRQFEIGSCDAINDLSVIRSWKSLERFTMPKNCQAVAEQVRESIPRAATLSFF